MRPMARYSKNYSRASVLVPKHMAGSLDAPHTSESPSSIPSPSFSHSWLSGPSPRRHGSWNASCSSLLMTLLTRGQVAYLWRRRSARQIRSTRRGAPDERATSQRSQSGVVHSEQMYSTHIDGTSASGIGRDRLVEQGLRSREMMVCS